jgi:hypothetical protein
MNNRRGLWIGICVLGAVAIFWGVGQAVGPSSGDVELRKSLEALKQVKTFRGAYIESASSTQHSERIWEVDCNKVIIHQQSHDSQENAESPFEMKEDEFLVGNERYIRDSNGSWENTGFAGDRDSANWYCQTLTGGSAGELLPNIPNMISHAMMHKGDKKTVNGARCREWKFEIVTAISSRPGTVCIGVDDHLPYEMTMDGGRYSYSDYNRPLQLEAPQATVQPASLPEGSN